MVPDKGPVSRRVLPFPAIVNHDELKLALLLNAINPRIGGLLISGPKGTGKTTVVRSLAALLPKIPVVKGCGFRCSPDDAMELCSVCASKLEKNGKLPTEAQKMRVINLPLSATEDRVVGSLDVERAIKDGIAALKPGILAEANQQILYVDEVNLLPDHIVDSLLDAAATGVNIVEREGVSVSHPARFIFIGSMNPEEGELRPQLLDRFPLHVAIEHPFSVEERSAIIKLNIEFEKNPEEVIAQWKDEESQLREELSAARKRMDAVQLSDSLMQVIAHLCARLKVDGVRPDIVIAKAAMAYAALDGRTEVTTDDVEIVSPLALSHRTRQRGILEPPSRENIRATLAEAQKKVKTDEPRSKDREPKGKDSRPKLLQKIGRFHALDEKQDGERHIGPATKRKTGGRLAYTGFVCFMMVMAAAIGILLGLFIPFPLNYVLGGVLSIGMILGLERILRFSKRPGSVLPSVQHGDTPPGRFDRFRPAKQQASSGGVPSSAATAPSIKGKSPKIRGDSRTRRPVSMPSLVRLDEGKPLFQLEDLIQPRFFGSWRAPKWSLRQVWRRTGSARSRTSQDGALVGAKIPQGAPRSIHFPATISASALHKTARPRQQKSLQIQMQDIREKRFRSRTPLTIIFVLDLSISMLKSLEKLKRSIVAFKTVLEGTRDRVGLIALKDWGAMEVQAPTANWTRLIAKLMTLSISGYTPLAAGLKRANETIKRERRRNPGTVPLIVVFSDYLPNIQLAKGEIIDVGLPIPIADALHQCHLLAASRIPVVTINLAPEFFRVKGKQHHAVIDEWIRKRSQELNIQNPIELGIKEDKLLPFLAYYMAIITGGRTYLGDELTDPTAIIPSLMAIAQRSA